MFKNIYEKKGRIQDLSLLPPCRESLNLRSQRCNYIAKVWKSSFQSTIDFDVITANGWSEEGQVIWMPETLKSALVGFHAFSGNDYISSIFRKSKLICWKKIEKSKKFTEMFVQLGNQWRIDGALQALLEEYVCALFMKGKRDINEVRYEMFKNIYEKKGRIQDLSLLPPCRESLNLRSQRCNYIAKVWKSSFQSTIDFDVITANGWSEEGQVIWMNEAFPPNVTEILMDAEEGSDSDETLDGESDSDYNSD